MSGGGLTRKYLSHFTTKSATIPRSRGWMFGGTKWSLMAAGGPEQLHKYVDRRHKKYGPIFRETLGGGVDGVFISDVNYMRQVFQLDGKYPVHLVPEAWTLYNKRFGTSRGLFFMNGQEWLNNRRIMNNFLLKGDMSYVNEACDVAAHNFAQLMTPKDLEISLYKWSLNTLIAVLLGARNYEEYVRTNTYDLRELTKNVKLIFDSSTRLEQLPVKWASHNNWKQWTNFVQCVDIALDGATDLVMNLMDVKYDGGLLERMMSAMPKSDVIKVIVDLILAAGDTTTYTMLWCLYNLAKHPELQNNLHIKSKYCPDTKVTSYRNFIKETLRLYPVAPFVTRVIVEEPVTVGPYRIDIGNIIILSLYTSGRNASLFPRPHSFDPDRWFTRSPDMQKATLHFAMGARSCIGRKIAERQLESTLEMIVKKYHVQLEVDEDIEMIMNMVVVPSKTLKLKLTPR
ncbi:PREDICTED: cytochrome P450 315a1, mitochondrial [Nicrophorus vespilloides]|uniref:Cytochrome P450 315a1, mitochondrial n=1 Tax=Nicrophorus vespilloides TaxID=110193 RepID=A0ABM1M5J9_NICVS|nr:PREDICTED: cytochrome P450 315a1, mitochondrial [Nicrophorus vespilloides]